MDLELLQNSMPDLHQATISEVSLEDLQHERVLSKYASRFQIYVSDFSSYKFRPHAIGRLMGGLPKPLTEKQVETLQAYQNKLDCGKNLTERQYEDYGSLLSKKNAKPTLSPGAKTYLKELFKEITFQRSKELKSKYLDKGLICEEQSIQAITEFFGEDFQKNTVRFQNNYFTGEPDIINGNEVIDIKSSWDYETFPMFDEELENKTYYWQILAYMDLLGLKKGRVIYVLNDTPDEIINDEKKRVAWQLGLTSEELRFDIPEDLEFEIERNMKYEDIPMEARIKEFEVLHNEKDLNLVKEIIRQSRIYLVELSKSLATRFVNHLPINEI